MEGEFRCYDPSAVVAAAAADAADATAATRTATRDDNNDDPRHLYAWRGDYDVSQRPWFAHALRSRRPEGSWTEPYADPVTGELVVSFVRALAAPELGAGVAIAGTFTADAFDALEREGGGGGR